MAQITNISNSADYQLMYRSTTITKDEGDSDDQQTFLTPSLDIDSSQLLIVDQATFISNENKNNSDFTGNDNIKQINTNQNPTNESYIDLSSSSSEESLARPLLQTNSRHSTVYIEQSDLNNGTVKPTSNTFVSNGINHRSSIKRFLLDVFLAAFLVAPLQNIHWRGAWDYLDICLLPNNELLSALISLAVGLSLLYGIYLTQYSVQSIYEKYQKRLFAKIWTRLHTLILALAYINQWRGLWNLLDLTSNHWIYLTIETVLSVMILLCLKSISTLNSVPFSTAVDTQFNFLIESKYQISCNRFIQHTFDFVYYELVEASLVVAAWRGLYNLSDLYIFPENKFVSMLTSFIFGYALFFILALTQIPFVHYCLNRTNQWIYSFLSNTFYLIAFVSVVQIWRSLWIVCEQYLNIIGRPLLTLWLCYIIAYLILICTFTSCSLNGPGGAKDAFIDDQSSLLFQLQYTSILKKRTRQISTNVNAQISDASSTETIINNERPDQSEPL